MVLGNEDLFMVATTVVQGVLLWDSEWSQGFGSTGSRDGNRLYRGRAAPFSRRGECHVVTLRCFD